MGVVLIPKKTDVIVQHISSGVQGGSAISSPCLVVAGLSPVLLLFLPRRDPSFLDCVLTHTAVKQAPKCVCVTIHALQLMVLAGFSTARSFTSFIFTHHFLLKK